MIELGRKLVVLKVILLLVMVLGVSCSSLIVESGATQVKETTDVLSPDVAVTEVLPTKVPTEVPPTEIPTPEQTPTEIATLGIPKNLEKFYGENITRIEPLVSIPVTGVVAIKFSPDGRYLYLKPMARAEEPEGLVIDLETGLNVVELEGVFFNSVHFNPNSTSIVSLQDNILREYDLRTGEKIVELSSESTLATLSTDGKLIVEILPSEEGQIGTSFRVVEIATGNEISRFYSEVPILATAFNFSPDGNTLVTTAVQMNAVFTTFFDIESGESLKVFNEYGKHYDFHAERHQVALASENRLIIDVFNMDTWEKEFSLGDATPIQRYFNLHYSSNGEYLYAINNLSTGLDFFDPETGGLLLSLEDKIEYISTIEISPTNDLLVSAANDGVIIWGIDPSTLAVEEPGDSVLTFNLNENIGWALESVDPAGSGDAQLILRKTTDGGKTWEVVLDPTDKAAALPGFITTGLVFADENYGWITQDSQGFQILVYLQVTRDGGVTWEGLEMPAPEVAPDIFKDCACGLYDPMLELLQSGSVCLKCNCMDEEKYPITKFIYHTEDGGVNWKIMEKND